MHHFKITIILIENLRFWPRKITISVQAQVSKINFGTAKSYAFDPCRHRIDCNEAQAKSQNKIRTKILSPNIFTVLLQNEALVKEKMEVH